MLVDHRHIRSRGLSARSSAQELREQWLVRSVESK
jgi:hypothetical protein